ncbi:hypothetical protein [Halorubellus salinus]|uniref:hypothetical protein n=1 Tax=Halorubellus salinus TaxID=755309 RepID=UPI001D06481F|nr:hypothetical protein [Halorubellus salinus]
MSGGLEGAVSVGPLDVGRGTLAVAAATVAAGVTVALVPFTSGLVLTPPVETPGVVGDVVADRDPAARRLFYVYVLAYDGVESAPLFLAAFAMVAAAGVRTAGGGERATGGSGRAVASAMIGGQVPRPVVLAFAAGVAVAVGYVLVGTVAPAVLPPIELGGGRTETMLSDVGALSVNAVVVAVVTAVGTAVVALAADAPTEGES